jgi:hypothetical protein
VGRGSAPALPSCSYTDSLHLSVAALLRRRWFHCRQWEDSRYHYRLYCVAYPLGPRRDAETEPELTRLTSGVSRYGLDEQGIGVRVPVRSRPAVEPSQRTVQWLLGVLFTGVKRQEREANHSSATSAEVKKTWICKAVPHTLIPSYTPTSSWISA